MLDLGNFWDLSSSMSWFPRITRSLGSGLVGQAVGLSRYLLQTAKICSMQQWPLHKQNAEKNIKFQQVPTGSDIKKTPNSQLWWHWHCWHSQHAHDWGFLWADRSEGRARSNTFKLWQLQSLVDENREPKDGIWLPRDSRGYLLHHELISSYLISNHATCLLHCCPKPFLGRTRLNNLPMPQRTPSHDTLIHGAVAVCSSPSASSIDWISQPTFLILPTSEQHQVTKCLVQTSSISSCTELTSRQSGSNVKINKKQNKMMQPTPFDAPCRFSMLAHQVR